MGVKSPSKYLSLEKLKRIKKDNYTTDSGLEYVASEVDQLIVLKTSGQAAEKIEREWKNYHKTPEPTFEDLRRIMEQWHKTLIPSQDTEVPF